MNLVTAVQRQGGVARTAVLIAAGHTRREIAGAVAAERLMRPRQGLVALVGADPHLIAAARHGIVLTCVTQAQRLGLWVHRLGPVHAAAPHPHSQLTWREGVRHWGVPVVPRAPGQLVDPIENVLDLIAGCQPRESALATLDSALNKRLVTIPGLQALAISTRLRALLAEADPFADSGLETIFRTRLGWLREPIRSQIWLLGHRVDFLIGKRLVIQIDGGHHVDAQRARDNAHDALLRLHGYHILRFTYAQIMHQWEEVQAAVLTAIAAGLHLVRAA